MRALLNAIKIICYVCSFPLFIALACVASMTNIKMGAGYGFMPYVSILVPIVFGLIWAIMVGIQEFKVKKDTVNKEKRIRKQTAAQVVVSVFLCAGVMMILDILIPPVLPGLTSHTIYYEDIAEEDAANNRAELNKDLLNAIIARSVMAGVLGADKDGYTQYYTCNQTEDIKGKSYTGYEVNVNEAGEKTPLVMTRYGYYVTLDSYKNNPAPDPDKTNETDPEIGWVRMLPTPRTQEEIDKMDDYFASRIRKYIKEGIKNKEVKSLLDRKGKNNMFGSLNLSGYESWTGPWIDFANDGEVKRMTVPVIVNLIIGHRRPVQSVGKPGKKDYANPAGNADGTRKLQTALYPYPVYNRATGKVDHLQIGWNVLDMMGDGLGSAADARMGKALEKEGAIADSPSAPMALPLGIGDEGLFTMLSDMLGGLNVGGLPIGALLSSLKIFKLSNDGALLGLKIPAVYYLVDSLLCTVSCAVGSPALAGTPIYKDGDPYIPVTKGSPAETPKYVKSETGEYVPATGDEPEGMEKFVRTDWQYGYAPLTLRLVNKDGSYGVRTVTGDSEVYLTHIGDKAADLGLYSNNYSRGTIGYMQYAWADSNGLLFAVTGLFAIRRTCYIFSAVIAVLAIVIGEARQALCKMDKAVLARAMDIKATPEGEGETQIGGMEDLESAQEQEEDGYEVVSYDEALAGDNGEQNGPPPDSYISY